jgi:acyl-CoA reductase-like NAD-dependent aldehyde dehydrogenase
LELGGDASVIVDNECDLNRAVNRTVFGAFSYSGQICISVQKIFIHKEIYEAFKKLFIEKVNNFPVGNPEVKGILAGPMIDSKSKEKVKLFYNDAMAKGATRLTAFKEEGNIIFPLVLENVSHDTYLFREEVFGPIVILEPFETITDAIKKVNESRYGIHAGIFTNNRSHALLAVDDITVGGVIINEIPTFRADQIPYGGVKNSGLGREGVRYAMEEYCERKTVIEWVGNYSG